MEKLDILPESAGRVIEKVPTPFEAGLQSLTFPAGMGMVVGVVVVEATEVEVGVVVDMTEGAVEMTEGVVVMTVAVIDMHQSKLL